VCAWRFSGAGGGGEDDGGEGVSGEEACEGGTGGAGADDEVVC
jgi:hypothetical protein